MLIALTGKKGHGKDAIASFIPGGILRFASPLKNMLRALYESAGMWDPQEVERRLEGDLKEVPCDILLGQTPRHAMQTLGTEWRNLIGEDLWVNIWRTKTQALLEQGIPVIVPDLRFAREQEVVRELGGYTIKVVRPGLKSDDTHDSETEMDRLDFDCLIWNDGSLDDLKLQVQRVINGVIL